MKVAVLKGFVFGINWNKHKSIKEDVIENLKPYDAIAWDGDLHKKNSFTDVLYHVMKKYPNKKYIAFKKGKHVHKLQSNYTENNYGIEARGYNTKIDVVAVNDSMKFNEMGIYAIQWLQRKYKKVDIFFLGQGGVAKKEEEKITKSKILFPNVTIKKYNVSRNSDPKVEKFTNIPSDITRRKISESKRSH